MRRRIRYQVEHLPAEVECEQSTYCGAQNSNGPGLCQGVLCLHTHYSIS